MVSMNSPNFTIVFLIVVNINSHKYRALNPLDLYILFLPLYSSVINFTFISSVLNIYFILTLIFDTNLNSERIF